MKPRQPHPSFAEALRQRLSGRNRVPAGRRGRAQVDLRKRLGIVAGVLGLCSVALCVRAVDLQVVGWWCPLGLETYSEWRAWQQRSRARETPAVMFHTTLRHLYRLLDGTPVDHPSRRQHVAEAVHLDEVREHRRQEALARSRSRSAA